MEGKLRAAADARRDGDLVIIARTDARGPAGLDAAIERANRYREAGADMTFPDALLSEEEFEAFARAVPGPKMMNMGGYAARRTTPKMPLEFLERIGFNVAIFPLAMLRAGARAERDFLEGLKARGTAFELEHIDTLKGHPDGELVRVHRDREDPRARDPVSPGGLHGTQVRREGLSTGSRRLVRLRLVGAASRAARSGHAGRAGRPAGNAVLTRGGAGSFAPAGPAIRVRMRSRPALRSLRPGGRCS